MKRVTLLLFFSIFFAFVFAYAQPALANEPPGASETEGAVLSPEEEDIDEAEKRALPPDLLNADCTSFYAVKENVPLSEEPLYRQHLLLLENFLFAKKSRFKLNPKDESLSLQNTSLLSSEFLEERTASLADLEEEYREDILYCLNAQAEALYQKELSKAEEIFSKEKAALKEILLKKEREIVENSKKRHTEITKSIEAKLQKRKRNIFFTSKKEGKMAKRMKRKLILNKTASPYSKTKKLPPKWRKKKKQALFLIKQERIRLVQENKKREKQEREELLAENDQAAKSLAAKEEETKNALKEQKEKSFSLHPDVAKESADKAYAPQRAKLREDEGHIKEQIEKGNALLQELKSLWKEDLAAENLAARKSASLQKKNPKKKPQKQKKTKTKKQQAYKPLLILDVTSIDLETESVTVRGVAKESSLGAQKTPRLGGGGVPSSMYYWSYMVSLYDTKSQGIFCSGAIIARKWVLTAAHCLRHGNQSQNPRNTMISVGAKNISRSPLVRRVDSYTIHPRFSYKDRKCILFVCWGVGVAGNIQNDVALLKLKKPVPKNRVALLSGSRANRYFHSYEQFLRRHSSSDPSHDPYRASRFASMTGYGKKCEDCQVDGRLRVGLGRLLSHKECDSEFSRSPSQRNILCVHRDSGRESQICSGDSGSPLVWRYWRSGATGLHVQKGLLIAVASFSRDTCNSQTLGSSGFFHIKPYYSWIKKTVTARELQ